MNGESYESLVMIPLLMVAVLGYYAVRLLVLHDTESIRGKNGRKLKDEEKYAKEAGKLMAFLALASLLMAGIMYFSVPAAVIQIVVCVVVFGVLWKKMHEKYGD